MASRSSRARASGFTYVGVLFGIALLGVGLASVGTAWHTTVQREREAELIFVGEQFSKALTSYYERSPEAGKTFPKSLQDLLEDRRSGRVVRHLRKVFVDPMTMGSEWGLKRDPQGRITGIHSLSRERPFRKSGFGQDQDAFAEALSYSDWVFSGTSGVGTPRTAVNPVVNGPPASPSLPPTTAVDPQIVEQERARLKERCEAEQAMEMGVCNEVVARLGPEAKARCEGSAKERMSICVSGSGQAPPPLYDGTTPQTAADDRT